MSGTSGISGISGSMAAAPVCGLPFAAAAAALPEQGGGDGAPGAAIAARPMRSRLLALVTAHGRLVAGLAAGAGAGVARRPRSDGGTGRQAIASRPSPGSSSRCRRAGRRPVRASRVALSGRQPGGESTRDDRRGARPRCARSGSRRWRRPPRRSRLTWRRIRGVVVRLKTRDKSAQTLALVQPAGIVRVAIGEEDIDKRRPSVRVESRLAGPDGQALSLSNEVCPVDDVARRRQRKSLLFWGGARWRNTSRNTSGGRGGAERRLRTQGARGPGQLPRQLRACLDRPRGRRDHRCLLADALDVDATCFSVRFELAWSSAMTGEMGGPGVGAHGLPTGGWTACGGGGRRSEGWRCPPLPGREPPWLFTTRQRTRP